MAMKSPSDFRTFLESLDAARGETEEMHGWRFGMSLGYFAEQCKRYALHPDGIDFAIVFEYIIERCRRAESRTPPDLKEQVKGFVLAGMDAERDWRLGGNDQFRWKVEDFRRLCEPEVKG